MRLSLTEYMLLEARRNRGRNLTDKPKDGTDNEGQLHDQIAAYCRERLWPVVHSRMDMKTTTAKGVPDFVIALPEGKTLWIECKTKTGKLTPEQIGYKMLLEKQGHRWALVRNFREFIEAVTENPS